MASSSSTAVRFGRISKSLKMGIVGLPNVGKSSLFNLLTRTSDAACEARPFCTIDSNHGSRPMGDDWRYYTLRAVWQPATTTPFSMEVWDVAGLVRGASEGNGLGNKFLSHIGAVDGIFHVVRAFDDPDVVHVDDSVDPIRDLDTVSSELCKKDLQLLGDLVGAESDDFYRQTMDKVRAMLEANKFIFTGDWATPEVELIKDKLVGLVTTKPQVYLVNLSKADYIRKRNKWLAPIHRYIQEHGGGAMIPISVEFEEELHRLETTEPASVAAFLAQPDDQPPLKSALPKAISEGFASLELIYFMTAGETEVRCWPIMKGWTAPEAAGTIHTDFQKFFIKAEVVAYTDFKELQTTKGMGEVKAAGKYRTEGRSYIVQDGDIIYFQVGRK